MALESANFINGLVITNPVDTDERIRADDHLRLVKTVLKNTFSDIGGDVSASAAEINFLRGVTTAIQTQINSKHLVTATAVNTIRWDGSGKVISTATASGGSDNDLWFQWE